MRKPCSVTQHQVACQTRVTAVCSQPRQDSAVPVSLCVLIPAWFSACGVQTPTLHPPEKHPPGSGPTGTPPLPVEAGREEGRGTSSPIPSKPHTGIGTGWH